MSLYEFLSYRKFMQSALAPRGEKKRLADFLGCQSGFISQILCDSADISLEHAYRATSFFGLSDNEADYFMILVQREKAGSKELKSFFDKKIEEMRSKREELKGRFQKVVKQIVDEDIQQYYSHWSYAAIHILTAIPGYQTISSISEKLNISPKKTAEVLNFLITTGLVVKEDGLYSIGKTRIHIGDQAKSIQQHHTNWRLKTIQKLDKDRGPQDFHYSLITSISWEDFNLLKSKMLTFLEEFEPTISASSEEDIFVLNIDAFNLN